MNRAHYRRNFEKIIKESVKLLKMKLDSFFQPEKYPEQSVKLTRKWFNFNAVSVLNGLDNLQTLTLSKNYGEN